VSASVHEQVSAAVLSLGISRCSNLIDPPTSNQADSFARPHDSTHVISGYDTTPHGEILVSTFTAGMHPKLPMEGHILPVIFSWHLGIEINKLAGSFQGALKP
jgi:hypothetical protein